MLERSFQTRCIYRHFDPPFTDQLALPTPSCGRHLGLLPEAWLPKEAHLEGNKALFAMAGAA